VIQIGRTRLTYRIDEPRDDLGATMAAGKPPAVTEQEREVLLTLLRRASAGTALEEGPATRAVARALHLQRAAVADLLVDLCARFGMPDGGENRFESLANEALRRGTVSLSDLHERAR